MNKLGTLKQCPKCNSRDLTQRYIPTEYASAFPKRIKLSDEYMQITCCNCSYEEREHTADYKQDEVDWKNKPYISGFEPEA
jgi:predicted nucleic-acid-binding Zn-ribbon protein